MTRTSQKAKAIAIPTALIASFTCPLPPTLNAQIRVARGRCGDMRSAQLKREWCDRILSAIKLAELPSFAHCLPAWYQCHWLLSNISGRDADNTQAAFKYIGDALVKSEAIASDSLPHLRPLEPTWSRGGDEVIVTLGSDRDSLLRATVERVGEVDCQSLAELDLDF